MTDSRPKDSNKRSIFRVGVVGAEVDAGINGLRHCSLIDVTSEGFAVVIAQAAFVVDQVVFVKLCYEGREFSGHARVRNWGRTRSDLYRYGLQTLPNEDQLRVGLRLIAQSEQRRRLRRQADRR